MGCKFQMCYLDVRNKDIIMKKHVEMTDIQYNEKVYGVDIPQRRTHARIID